MSQTDDTTRVAGAVEDAIDLTAEPQHVPVNMWQTTEGIVLVAAMPGVKADDIDVLVEGRTVTMRAQMRTAAPKDYILHEWHYGPFERTVELPDGFGGDATASYGNGQLVVRVLRGEGSGGRIDITPAG